MSDLMAFLDVETFGLNHKTDPLLEVGLYLVNNDFEVVHMFESTVWDHTVSDGRLIQLEGEAADGNEDAAWLLETHTKNRLLEDAQADERTFKEVQENLLKFMIAHKVCETPIYGASVQFDRESLRTWMRTAHNAFHYRNVDISTLKELCRRFNPDMYDHMEEDVRVEPSNHRVMNCLAGTVAEAQWYAENFLYIPGNKRDFPVPQVD